MAGGRLARVSALAAVLAGAACEELPPLPNLPPVASFVYSPVSPIYAGQTQVTFNASASRDDDGTVSAYRWDFGDGSAQEGASPTTSHVYPVVGRCLEVTYTVLLTIVDDKSGRGSANQTIKVIQLPIPGSAECPR